MAINLRNLLLFISLSSIALLTWVLARDPELPQATGERRESAPTGYFVVDAVFTSTDDEGQIEYRIFADRMEQESQGEDIEFDGLRLEYPAELGIRWTLTATRGLASENRACMDLFDGVRLIQESEAGLQEIAIETQALRLCVDDYLVSTEHPVAIQRDHSRIDATGLKLDLENDHMEIDNAIVRSTP